MAQNLDTIDAQSKLSKTWRVFSKYQTTYTGGPLLYSADHTHMICVNGLDPTSVIFVRLSTGQIVHTIECGDEDPVDLFTCTPNQQQLITYHNQSTLIKVWNIETKLLVSSFKSQHRSNVSSIECDATGTLLATASMDQSVYIRYITTGHLTHHFTNHGSAITSIAWHPNPQKLLLAVGTQDGIIRVHWLGQNSSATAAMVTSVSAKTAKKQQNNQTQQDLAPKCYDLLRNDYDGSPKKSHVGRVTSLTWSPCHTRLLSAGHDKTWRVWDFVHEYQTAQRQLHTKSPNSSPLPSISHIHDHFDPAKQLKGVEIVSHLVLDDLQGIVALPLGATVPVRKRDNSGYSTLMLKDDANERHVSFFATIGVRGVYSIWKIAYNYIDKKPSIGIVFKQSSLQMFAATSLPYLDESQSHFIAMNDGSNVSGVVDENAKDLFDTPIHLQWTALQLFVPPQDIINPPVKTIIDPRDTSRTLKRRVLGTSIPSLPYLDADKEYEETLRQEVKYYESKRTIQQQNNMRREYRQQQQTENAEAALNQLDDDDDVKDEDDEDEDNADESGDDSNTSDNNQDNANVDGDEESDIPHIDIEAKLAEFRGFAPQESRVYLLNADHNLFIYDLAQWKRQKLFSLYQQQVNDSKIIPGTRCVVVATNSNQLRIWNVDTLSCDILVPHNDTVLVVAVSQCGNFMISSALSGQVFVWVLYRYDEEGFISCQDSNSHRKATRISAHLVAELKGHTDAVSALAFSHEQCPTFDTLLQSTTEYDAPHAPNGKNHVQTQAFNYNRLSLFACSASNDHTLKTWNLSALYVFIDPQLASMWQSTLSTYRQLATKDAPAISDAFVQLTTAQAINQHIFVQMGADKTTSNVSFVLYHSLFERFTRELTTTGEVNTLAQQLPPTRLILAPSTSTLAHLKDINSICIHPNNRSIVTASEDRTAMVWNYTTSSLASSLQLQATLKGHRRALWNAIFTPFEKFIITISSDKLVKVWNTEDYTCVNTIQGHTAGIVGIQWIRLGVQFITTDAEGMLRVWNLHDSGEPVACCDEPHDCRITGLDIDNYHNDAFMVTGDSSSLIAFWKDTTLHDELLEQQKRASEDLQTQLLENALERKEWEKAFELALSLQHTRRLYHILVDIIDQEVRYKKYRALRHQREQKRQALRIQKVLQAKKMGDTRYDPDTDPEIVGQEEIFLMLEARENIEIRVPKPKVTVKSLLLKRSLDELSLLTNLLVDWNTNSKYAYITHYVLNVILSWIEPTVLIQVPHFEEKIEALISYSQRHYTRFNNLLQSSYIVDHVLSNVNIYMPLHQPERAKAIGQISDENDDNNNNNATSQANLLQQFFDDADTTNNAVLPQHSALLQNILSLDVDREELQYEIVSDDETDVTPVYSVADLLHNDVIRAFDHDQVQDDDSSEDESSDSDDDYEDDKTIDPWLKTTSDQKDFMADSWGNFDDDWATAAAANQ